MAKLEEFKKEVDLVRVELLTVKDNHVRATAFSLFKKRYVKRATGLSFMFDVNLKELIAYVNKTLTND